MLRDILKAYRAEAEGELLGNILPFWLKHAPDEEHGGFYGRIENDLRIDAQAPKGLVLCARILWTFSAAHRYRPDEAYLRLAERAYAYLTSSFRDREHGGYYWLLDHEGRPLHNRKQIYGQAFAIYAFAEYYRATGRGGALEAAQELYGCLERYARDPEHGGYWEAFTRDWRPPADVRLSAKDLNEKKSMNTHLHVLEAYTNLLRVWEDPGLHARVRELIEVFLDRIVDPVTHHFHLFFDECWAVRSDHISYGHDIEGSWLLCEAAEVLGDPDLRRRTEEEAVRMAAATLAEGVDTDGALFYEAGRRGIVNPDKDWWPQAEAAVGFLQSWRLSGEERFLRASLASWRFIREKLVDREHGEWFAAIKPDGRPDPRQPKADMWKCPYHNGRACLEIIRRVEGAGLPGFGGS